MVIVYRLSFFAIALVAAWAALYPNLTLPEPALTRGYTDKIYHVATCLVLALLAQAGWRIRPAFYVLIIPFSIAAEIIQSLAPGRGVHVSDMIANLLGLCLAILIVRALNRDRQPGCRKATQHQQAGASIAKKKRSPSFASIDAKPSV